MNLKAEVDFGRWPRSAYEPVRGPRRFNPQAVFAETQLNDQSNFVSKWYISLVLANA